MKKYSQSTFLDRISVVNESAFLFYALNPKNDLKGFDRETLIDTFRQLNHFKVNYLLIGGYAMAFHGRVRATEDLDIWVEHSNENIENFKKALTALGVAGLENVRDMQLVPGFSQMKYGNSHFTLDPMSYLKAFKATDFDECYQRADKVSITEDIEVPILNTNDLLTEKKATNRPKDQEDINFLEAKGKTGK